MANAYHDLLQTREGRQALFEEQTIFNVTNRVCELLEQSGMTRAELAKKMGVSAGRVSQMLDGESNMTLSTVAKLFGAFDAVMEVGSRRIEDDNAKPCFFYHAEDWKPRRLVDSPAPRFQREPRYGSALTGT